MVCSDKDSKYRAQNERKNPINEKQKNNSIKSHIYPPLVCGYAANLSDKMIGEEAECSGSIKHIQKVPSHKARHHSVRLEQCLVGYQHIVVVNPTPVLDLDVERTRPSRSEGADAVVGVVGVGVNQVAVLVIDVEVEVGVAVT